MQQRFDIVVIGSGPGGEGAAMKAAKCGRSVAAIERYAARHVALYEAVLSRRGRSGTPSR